MHQAYTSKHRDSKSKQLGLSTKIIYETQQTQKHQKGHKYLAVGLSHRRSVFSFPFDAALALFILGMLIEICVRNLDYLC